jgi:hypothetical protein
MNLSTYLLRCYDSHVIFGKRVGTSAAPSVDQKNQKPTKKQTYPINMKQLAIITTDPSGSFQMLKRTPSLPDTDPSSGRPRSAGRNSKFLAGTGLGCLGLVLIAALAVSQPAYGVAVRNLAGFTTTVYGGNDDGTYPAAGPENNVPPGTPVQVPVGFSMNFFGVAFNSVYVNNNGNVTLDAPLSTFTPFGLAGTSAKIIAPFFADVDTRGGNTVTFGNDTVDGHNAFGVNWPGVGYFGNGGAHLDKLNDFQLILIDRSDTGAGNFDIEFNYNQIQWETGDASGGIGGLGGTSAAVGFSNGGANTFELPGSLVNGALIDGGPNALISHDLNSGVLGRYDFAVRGGIVQTPELGSSILNLGLSAIALLGFATVSRRRK